MAETNGSNPRPSTCVASGFEFSVSKSKSRTTKNQISVRKSDFDFQKPYYGSRNSNLKMPYRIPEFPKKGIPFPHAERQHGPYTDNSQSPALSSKPATCGKPSAVLQRETTSQNTNTRSTAQLGRLLGWAGVSGSPLALVWLVAARLRGKRRA